MSRDGGAALLLVVAASGCVAVEPEGTAPAEERGDHAATDGLSVRCLRGIRDSFVVHGYAWFIDDDADRDPALRVTLTPNGASQALEHYLEVGLKCLHGSGWDADLTCREGSPQGTRAAECSQRGVGAISVQISEIDCSATLDDSVRLWIELASTGVPVDDCSGYRLEVTDQW